VKTKRSDKARGRSSQPLTAVFWRIVLFLSLCLSPPLLIAVPFHQDSGPDGLVVMEAENNDGNTPQGGRNWVEVFAPAGFSGTSAFQARPTCCTNVNTGYVTQSPRLDYQIDFTRTGTHYVWVHARGESTSNNSLHVGLDGVVTPSSEAIQISAGAGWVWTTDRGGTNPVAMLDVATAGVHTINVWMREDGAYVDKLLLTTSAAYTPTGLEPESLRGGTGGTTLFADDFNDGNANGWSPINNCIKGAAGWSVVGTVFMQTGDCRGYSPEGVAIGTHALSSATLAANVDIQLRLRSQDPATDAVASNDSIRWKFHSIGILFGYQDADNHYRLEFDGVKGHRKLWRKQGGVFTELNSSPQSYERELWTSIRVLFQNGVILVFVDDQQVMATADSTFSSGKLALFCARNASCSFDDIVVANAPIDPALGLVLPDSADHASSEYFVSSDGTVDVSGISTLSSGIGGIEFVVDEGSGGEISQSDLQSPYSWQFNALAPGEHTLTGYLLDAGGARFTTPDATVTVPQLGSSGIHLVGMGDSITNGVADDFEVDNRSLDFRNTGSGYEQVLNDYLSADNGLPVTVLNEGNPGEESSQGAARISEVLARTPEAQAYLVFYGANDSGGSLPRPSGLGLSAGDQDYGGSFKDYMQRIVDAIVLPPAAGAGKLVFLAKTSPYLQNPTRNAMLVKYNQVIDELVAQLRIDYPSSYLTYVPPDFHAYFTTNPTEITADGIHPGGAGYQSMARLWCEALDGQQGWACADADGDGLGNLLEFQLGTNAFLMDTDGDGLDDFAEVAYDGDASAYTQGQDPDPLLPDTDTDGLADGNDPIPLDFNFADGDLAPLGAPDGQVNAGDYLLALRITLGLLTVTSPQLAHGDLYPPGAPDGVINIQDLILLQQLL
jgi:lysophospholipase L1-like esterase